jgi:hypothetical protein
MQPESATIGTFHAIHTAQEIRALEDELHKGLRRNVELAAEIGELLEQAKRELPHGQYDRWVKQTARITKSSAHRYRAVAKLVREGGAPTEHLTVNQFLRLMKKAGRAAREERHTQEAEPTEEPAEVPASQDRPPRLTSPTEPSNPQRAELLLADNQIPSFLAGQPITVDGQEMTLQKKFVKKVRRDERGQSHVSYWMVDAVRLEIHPIAQDSPT